MVRHLLDHRLLDIPVDKEMVGQKRSPNKQLIEKQYPRRGDQPVPKLAAKPCISLDRGQKPKGDSYFIHCTRDFGTK